MEAGEQLLKPGTACKDVDAVVRTSLGRDGLDQYFNSHVGHGLGLGHPDPPYLTSESSDILEQGNVVTLEPGVFFPGEFGIRVERNYLITESSCEILTRHSLDVDGVVASH
jgi:Xaa-Pro aminopeptidase